MKSATEGRVRLVEARGSLWSGSAQLEFRDAYDLAGIAQGIRWHFLPSYLFKGRIGFDIALEQSPQHFPVSVSPSQLSIGKADIRLPAAAQGLAVPKIKPFGLGGNILLKIDELNIKAGEAKGNAIVEWRSARSALTPVSPLGDYAMHYNSDGPGPHFMLSTLVGPLQLDGHEETAAGGKTTVFLVSLNVAEPFRLQLTPLLRLIAVELGPGSFMLKVE